MFKNVVPFDPQPQLERLVRQQGAFGGLLILLTKDGLSFCVSGLDGDEARRALCASITASYALPDDEDKLLEHPAPAND